MIASVCGGRPMWYQGCTWLTIHGTTWFRTTIWNAAKPTAAWIAPSDRAAAERHDEHDPEEALEVHEVGVVVDGALVHREQAAADRRDRGRQREHGDPRPGRADADRRGRGLAAPAAREYAAGRAFADRDHDDAEMTSSTTRHRTRKLLLLVVSKLIEPDRRPRRRLGQRAAADPVELHHDVLEEQRERERRERQEDATEPERRQREQRTDRRRRARAPMTIASITDTPKRVASCAVVHAPMAANVAMHRADLAGHAGDHRDREEDRRRGSRPWIATSTPVRRGVEEHVVADDEPDDRRRRSACRS